MSNGLVEQRLTFKYQNPVLHFFVKKKPLIYFWSKGKLSFKIFHYFF